MSLTSGIWSLCVSEVMLGIITYPLVVQLSGYGLNILRNDLKWYTYLRTELESLDTSTISALGLRYRSPSKRTEDSG